MKITNISTKKNVVFENEYVISSIDWGTASGNLKTIKSANQLGESVTSRGVDGRDISITGYIKMDGMQGMTERKKHLTRLINPLDPLTIEHNGKIITGTPTSTLGYAKDKRDNNDNLCKFMFNMYCEYPFFLSQEEWTKHIALWIAEFSFPLDIDHVDGVIFGSRQQELIVNAENIGDVPIGFVVKFRSQGTVVNPSIFNIETREYIKVLTTMDTDSVITISTAKNNKFVELERNNVITDISNLLDFGSTFGMELAVGDNLFRYNADSNIDSLQVSIHGSYAYWGVD